MDNPDQRAEGWNARYAAGRPPWDLGDAPPALTDLIQSLPASGQRVLVPCAGLGHDALAWAAAGYPTIAVDFAALAVEGAQEIAQQRGVDLTVLQADLFHLPDTLENSFDIIWEQTCLAALQPKQRGRYFRAMAWALKPEGVFWGLVWNHGRSGGPPFDITIDLVEKMSAPCFQLDEWRIVDPAMTARNTEFLVKLTRRS
jgi:methyl halide transferase